MIAKNVIILTIMLVSVIPSACNAFNQNEITSKNQLVDRPSFEFVNASNSESAGKTVNPFIDYSKKLGESGIISNRLPGVAIFDFDRDGDQDFYLTNAEVNALFPLSMGASNRLMRNDGNTFTNIARESGVDAPEQNSSGVVACDINNDGYQDLYVGGYGRIGDQLDYRSVPSVPGLYDAVSDRLFLNQQDGTFEDITMTAFGEYVNVRSAASVGCADINNDGWNDIYVGNRADIDFVRFDNPRHHGHYNVLYKNNGDNTFSDVTDSAGLRGEEVTMFDPFGRPIKFKDPVTGVETEGFDAMYLDANGNIVGDPAGQTWAMLFFDHDDDGDQDLWLVDDGDRTKVFRNDSTEEEFLFTNVAREMGIDTSGAGMGFAVGDYDSDGDLDVFITNIGFHPLTRGRPTYPGGDCAYAHQFVWGSCLNYLMENRGTLEVPGVGIIPRFVDMAAATEVIPSKFIPPDSLDPRNIQDVWQIPTGLAAYDFGFGTTFFDMENDGDQDLYWLGSMISKGEGPGGQMFPSAGRMLRNIGNKRFEDVTVEAHLLDILNVDYSNLDPEDPDYNATKQRIAVEFHENGKGVAKGDLNGDGYLDLIATNAGSEIFKKGGELALVKGRLFVWLNDNSENSWLTVRLKGRQAIDGTGSNADGLGARLILETTDSNGNPSRQVSEVTASSSFLSMNSIDQHFGLGKNSSIDRLIVYWPSGKIQIKEKVQVNSVLEVLEPE